MFHYKKESQVFLKNILVLILIFFGMSSHSLGFEVSRRGTSLNYTSWVENLRVTQGNVFEDATASFAGYEFNQQTKILFPNQRSLLVDFGLIFGQAQAGGSSTLLRYTSERQNFYGFLISPAAHYRHSSSVMLKLGPSLLYRSTKWKSEDPTLSAKSGAEINMVILGTVEFLVGKKLYIDQSFGGIAFNGKAFWSFGLGYIW